MPIVQLSSNFVNQLAALKENANQAHAAATMTGVRKWFIPQTNGWTGSPNDIIGLRLPFNRQTTNSQYVDAVNSGDGNSADIIAANIQCDYLSVQERAYRSRHMNSIRASLHTANRDRGHAANSGIFDMVQKHVENIISSGA